MARLPRLIVPGHLHLLLQRSHGGSPVFRENDDFISYREALAESAREHGVAIHAYAVLPSQVLMLVTPANATALSRMWQALGRRFGAGYNRRHRRTGVLWEGRFRTTVVDAHAHLLDCSRYVERMPVGAGLVDAPADYPWSSAAHHVGVRADGLVTEHAGFWALGNTPFDREARYRRLLAEPLPAALQARITHASIMGWALGDASFARAVGQLTPRRVVPLSRGRPRKEEVKKTVPE